MHFQSSVYQEAMAADLVGLRSQIGRVEVALRSRRAPQSSTSDIEKEESRIIHNLQQYVRVAESFHSNASNIAESVNGGSVIGDTLTQDRWASIEQWIPPPHIAEEPGEEDSYQTMSSSPSTNPSTKRQYTAAENPVAHPSPVSVTAAPKFHESDSESDLEKETTRKFHELSLRSFSQRDYSKAETFLRKLINRTPLHANNSTSENELFRTRTRLAIACSFQEKWGEAREIVLPLAQTKDHVDVDVFHIIHALALVYKDKGDLISAVKYTKQSLNGKRKALGRTDPSFLESMTLLAHIYYIMDDRAEAEVYRSLLPAAYRYDSFKVPALTALQYMQKSFPGHGQEEPKVVSAPSMKLRDKSRLIVGIDFVIHSFHILIRATEAD